MRSVYRDESSRTHTESTCPEPQAQTVLGSVGMFTLGGVTGLTLAVACLRSTCHGTLTHTVPNPLCTEAACIHAASTHGLVRVR